MTINLTAVSENPTVLIIFEPSRDSSSINLKSHGKFDVAILSSPDFSAFSLDVESLRFGRTGTEDSVSRQKHGGIHLRLQARERQVPVQKQQDQPPHRLQHNPTARAQKPKAQDGLQGGASNWPIRAPNSLFPRAWML